MTFRSGRPSRSKTRKLTLSLLMASTLIIPTACSQIADRFDSSSSKKDTIRSETGFVQNDSVETPPGPRTVAPPRVNTTQARPAGQQSSRLARPKGLVDNRRLFDTPVSDPIERIRRIELAVQDLRDDFDTAIPAMAGLVVSESELSQVLEDLKRAGDLKYTDVAPPKSASIPRQPLEPSMRSSTHKSTAPRTLAPMTDKAGAIGKPHQMFDKKATDKPIETTPPPKVEQKAVKKLEAQPPKKAATVKITPKAEPKLSGTHVVNVRVGSYPDKTRIVLDLNAPARYDVDLDNGEKLLVLEVKGAKWSARDSFTFKDSPLLSSFSAQDNGANGSRLLLTLKKPVKVVKKFALKKDGPRKDRIVLDIAPE